MRDFTGIEVIPLKTDVVNEFNGCVILDKEIFVGMGNNLLVFNYLVDPNSTLDPWP